MYYGSTYDEKPLFLKSRGWTESKHEPNRRPNQISLEVLSIGFTMLICRSVDSFTILDQNLSPEPHKFFWTLEFCHNCWACLFLVFLCTFCTVGVSIWAHQNHCFWAEITKSAQDHQKKSRIHNFKLFENLISGQSALVLCEPWKKWTYLLSFVIKLSLVILKIFVNKISDKRWGF